MRDSYGREISYLRVSVTDRCNLRCRYCMPEEGVPLLAHDQILSYEQITAVAREAAAMGCWKVRITGGEPLARKGIASLVEMLGSVPGIRLLAMTTNGTLLAPLAGRLASAGLDSVNISLDTLDPVRYAFLTRGGELSAALAGLDAAIAAGLAVKLNMVVLEDTKKSEMDALREFAEKKGAGLQTISRYSLQEEKRTGGGYDRPPPCASCNRIRLLANGFLRPCLHSDINVKVDFPDVRGSIEKAIRAKPPCGKTSETISVGQIGG